MATLLSSATFISRKLDGTPNALGRVYTYAAGTLTPLASYTTQAGGTSNTNPVVLDADGTAQIWLTSSSSYRIIEKTAADVTIRDADNILPTELAELSSTAAGKGDALVAVKLDATGSAARTQHDKNADVVSVKDFGAVGNGSTDDTAAIQAAIDAVTSLSGASRGGEVFLPAGCYRTTAQILLKHGVSLRGQTSRSPGGAYNGSTAILGDHTGAAILSLKGAHCCRVIGLSILSTSANIPKTGLLLGRNSAGSAGLHHLEDINVEGYFSKAAIYSIASESNVWIRPTFTVYGGGAKYGFFTSQGDELTVDSLTGSSNLENTILGMEGIHIVNDPTMVGLYIGGGASTGSWTFVGAYIIQAGGAYIEINSGGSDGMDTLGPITFTGTSGEIYNTSGSNSPVHGYKLSGTTGLCGFTVNGGRFEFRAATGNERTIYQAAGVTLRQPSVHLQTMANATVELQADKIQDGFISAGAQSFTAPSLTNSWATTYATANAIELPGYWRDPTGLVHLRGAASSGTVGLAIFTLPAGYRPASSVVFSVLSNGAVGRLDVSSAGAVTLTAGSNVYVSLSGVSFKAA